MKMTSKGVFVLMTVCFLASCSGNGNNFGEKVKQVSIHRVDSMPDMPETYKMLDWKQKAQKYDQFIFDWNNKSEVGPLIWLDDARRNMDQTTFGLYTAIKDIRQGKNANNGEFHESLNSLAAILGAGLLGIDKTNQDGYNYVKMVQNYFNSDNGWNIVMNNTTPSVALLGGGYGRDWWYDVLPNALYYAICDVFPNVDGAEKIQKSIAEQFVKADSVLNGNYDYSYFDYAQMKGMVNNMKFDDYLQEQLKDPEFKKEWDDIQPEMDVIRAMIDARIEQNLTQKELAARTGIDQADISKLENGTRNPSLKLLKKLASGLGMQLKIEFVPMQTLRK